jgi:hypothetical protein
MISDNYILFLHVQKTGGTSFRRMLIEEFGNKSVFPNDHDLASMPNGWYPSTEWINKNKHHLREHYILVGHHPYSLSKELIGHYGVITFIREPINRTISMIGQRRRTVAEYNSLNFEEILDIDEFIQSYILNYQTKIFGMPINDHDSPYKSGRDTLQSAISNLHECKFVGLLDRFEESCKLFDKIFKTNTFSKIRHDNIADFNSEKTERLTTKIKPLVNLDLEFYNEAVKIFNTDLRSYGIKL